MWGILIFWDIDNDYKEILSMKDIYIYNRNSIIQIENYLILGETKSIKIINVQDYQIINQINDLHNLGIPLCFTTVEGKKRKFYLVMIKVNWFILIT